MYDYDAEQNRWEYINGQHIEQEPLDSCPFCGSWNLHLEKKTRSALGGNGSSEHRQYYCQDCGKLIDHVIDANGTVHVDEYREPDYDWDDPWEWG